MFVVGLFGYNFRGPLVRSWIAVAMENLRGVIAQERVDFVFTVPPISIQEVRQILCQANNRDTFRPGRRLKNGILVNGEVVCLVLP